jgi:hypothetical protein
MDDDTHEILRRAIALDNQTRRDFECWQVERERQQTIVRKDYSPPDLLTLRPPPQPTTMSAEAQEPWDRWAKSLVDQRMDVFIEASGQAMSEYFRKRFNEEVAPLREEIASLRDEIASLRCDMTFDHSAGGPKVLTLPGPFLRKRA